VFAAAVSGGLLCHLVLSVHTSGDYNPHSPVGGDNAGPGIAALLHGNLSGYLQHQPIVGLTSVLLRLPVVAIASRLGAGDLSLYKVGALVCLLPLALITAWMLAAPGLSPAQRAVRLLAILVVVQSPILRRAVTSGHPENVLAQLLGVVAVILAMRAHTRWAAVVLGLAVATKESAAIAVLPVLEALPGRRRTAAAIAGAVVLALVCAGWIAEPSAFLRALHGEGHTRFLMPLSLLWPLASPVRLAGGHPSLAHVIPWGLTRTGATLLTLAVAAIPASWWYLRSRRHAATCDPLAMLALLGALRCLCDSTHELYYYAALLLPLVAWEALEDRLPLGTALCSLGVAWAFSSLGRVPGPEIYLLWTTAELLVIAYLARHALRAHPAVLPARGHAVPESVRRLATTIAVTELD
jgi:hypothetical protein